MKPDIYGSTDTKSKNLQESNISIRQSHSLPVIVNAGRSPVPLNLFFPKDLWTLFLEVKI